MKKICSSGSYSFFLLFFAFIKLTNASESLGEYSIVFDAGSSKTRAYLYQSSVDKVTQIAVSKDSKALSSFISNVDSTGNEVILPLIKELRSKISNSDNNIEINVLGTAGMRKLTDAQQSAIYGNVRQSIIQAGYKPGQIRTITGGEEGVFAWVHINQLAEKLGTDNTLGIIEMGGASTQITFDTKDSSLAGTHPIKLKGKIYYLWSESLLGFGANSVRSAMNKINLQQTCYPLGYEKSLGFNFNLCDQAYDKVIHNDNIAYSKLKQTAEISALKKTNFIGLSALNYTLDFFDNQKPEKEKLKKSLIDNCKSYDDIKILLERDPQKDYHEPQFKCSNGTFVYNLLYDYLKLANATLQGVKKYNNTDVRWTAGYTFLSTQTAKK
ncbi:MAG TPA: hypothetical protein ACHBY4_03280 [Arsenophonus apicola]|jgi:Golgi nucleoside diphosphatase|uniref:hypothetical protein n=1 Tax=Arsenophonus apicola TaxID=2879119 RepID=UPI0038793BFD